MRPSDRPRRTIGALEAAGGSLFAFYAACLMQQAAQVYNETVKTTSTDNVLPAAREAQAGGKGFFHACKQRRRRLQLAGDV